MEKTYSDLVETFTNKLDRIEVGEEFGWTTGIPKLDGFVGRIDIGQVWAIGGFTGTGKSYFILNMIEGILQEWRSNKKGKYVAPKIAVYSTELNADQYFQRHVCMRCGIYFNQYKQDPKKYKLLLQEEADNYLLERKMHPESLQIIGDLNDLNDLKLDKLEYKPNIVFIDYIQELSFKNLVDVKDSMPVIVKTLKKLATTEQVAIIAVSQINNSAIQGHSNPRKQQMNPFSWGKELMQAAHAAVYLEREMLEEGVSSKELIVSILKARDGDKGWFNMMVNPGFKLLQID